MGKQNRKRRAAERRKVAARHGRVRPSSPPPTADRDDEHRSDEIVRREHVRDELLRVISDAWTRGWQPVELVRHVRRSGLDPWCQDLLARAIVIEWRLAELDVHPSWAGQLRGITANPVSKM